MASRVKPYSLVAEFDVPIILRSVSPCPLTGAGRFCCRRRVLKSFEPERGRWEDSMTDRVSSESAMLGKPWRSQCMLFQRPRLGCSSGCAPTQALRNMTFRRIRLRVRPCRMHSSELRIHRSESDQVRVDALLVMVDPGTDRSIPGRLP